MIALNFRVLNPKFTNIYAQVTPPEFLCVTHLNFLTKYNFHSVQRSTLVPNMINTHIPNVAVADSATAKCEIFGKLSIA